MSAGVLPQWLWLRHPEPFEQTGENAYRQSPHKLHWKESRHATANAEACCLSDSRYKFAAFRQWRLPFLFLRVAADHSMKALPRSASVMNKISRTSIFDESMEFTSANIFSQTLIALLIPIACLKPLGLVIQSPQVCNPDFRIRRFFG